MRTRLALACLGLLVAVAGAALAAPTPAQKCSAAKLKSSGKAGSANGLCASKASQSGTATDPACLGKSDDKLTSAFAKAELKGGCPTTGDAGAIATTLDGVTAFAETDLGDDGSPASRKCAAARRKAAGKYVAAALGCHAKAQLAGTSVDSECLDKAAEKLSLAFDKSQATGGCSTVADAPATKTAMDAVIADVVAALLGSPTTTTTTTSTTTTTVVGPPVSFSADVQPIFTANCIGCHSGMFPAQSLDLSVGNAYGALVNVASVECGPTLRVAPGNPAASYLVHKLQGSGPCFSGFQMPLFAAPLSMAQQQLISDWIAQGAANN